MERTRPEAPVLGSVLKSGDVLILNDRVYVVKPGHEFAIVAGLSPASAITDQMAAALVEQPDSSIADDAHDEGHTVLEVSEQFVGFWRK